MLWGRIAKYVLCKAEEKWRAKGSGLPFGGQHDNEYKLRGMMWADNHWLFSDSREVLICMVNEITEEPMDLWSPSRNRCKHEDVRTLRLGGRDRAWDWDTVFIGTGDSKVPNAPCARAWEAGGVMNTSIAQRRGRWVSRC